MNIYKFLDSITSSFGIFHGASGLGTIGDNSKTAAINTHISTVSEKEANTLFIHAGLLQRVIELYPDLASLLELEITSTTEIDEQKIKDRIKELNLQQLFVDATKSARLFKEAYLVLDVDDNSKHDTEVNLDIVRGIRDIYFLEFGTLKPIWNRNRTERVAYELNLSSNSSSNLESTINIENKTIIHASRVLLFCGKRLTAKQQALNGGYHASMIDSLVPAYASLEIAHNNATNIFSRLLTFLFKMKGLNKHQDAGHTQMIQNRISLSRQTIGTLGGILLDEETENIEPMTVPLTGIPETLNSINKYFTAQTSLSHDQLWNEGSHSTASDLENKNTISAVKAFIKQNWEKNWNTVIDLISKEFTSEKINVNFKVPSFELTLQEEIALRQTQASVDKTYIDLGVLSREIIQGNRFMQNSLQTNLNVKSEVDIQDEDERKAEMQTRQLQITQQKENKSRNKKVEDASFSSSQDYQISSAEIKQIFEDIKDNAPLLFEFLDSDSTEE